MANNDENRGGRGFASMDEEKQRDIASRGGKAAHEKGTAHEFDSRTGSAAAKKRGQGNQNNPGSEQNNRENIDQEPESGM